MIDRVVQAAIVNGAPQIRVPDADISVHAACDRALPRMQAEQLGRIGRGDRNESLQIDPPLADAFRKQYGMRVSSPGTPLGIREMAPPARPPACPWGRQLIRCVIR